jgi:uncharacterized protein YjiS (DUF1127 family)
MANILTSLLRNAGRRKIYADLMQLDDHLLRDIGLTRMDVSDLITRRGHKVNRAND